MREFLKCRENYLILIQYWSYFKTFVTLIIVKVIVYISNFKIRKSIILTWYLQEVPKIWLFWAPLQNLIY